MGGVLMGTSVCCCHADATSVVEQLRHGRVLERQSAAACLASMARSKAWPGGRQTGQNRGGTCPFVQAQKETGWMPTAAVTNGQTAELRENAARALANLPMCDAVMTNYIMKAGGVTALVRLVDPQYPYGCRAQACRALGNMCVSSQAAAKEVRQAGAVQPLLRALFTEEHPASTGPNLVAEAALAVANFASVDAQCRDVVLQSAVAIPGLQHLLTSQES
eukprot:symbB.v1.2.034285.t3/scaffold4397.1/size40204/5